MRICIYDSNSNPSSSSNFLSKSTQQIALKYRPPSASAMLSLSIGVEMEPKWRDMCQIELSASTNTAWDGGGGRIPEETSPNLVHKRLLPPVGRHLDCFRSEHALLKIHKKGCGSAGCPPPHLMYCSYACLSRSLRLPICLVQVSHLAFIAHSRRNFLCEPPSLLSLSFTPFFHAPRPRSSCTLFWRAWGFENARLRATKANRVYTLKQTTWRLKNVCCSILE